MSETVTSASKALADWPLWNAIFLVIVAFAGLYFRFLGSRDRKSGVTGADVPTYIMLHDATKDVSAILAEMKRLNTGQEYTHRILEDMRNNQE